MSGFGDDVREMMVSRNIEKMQFPVLDMLRNEQKEKKNVSVEKDDFSEVIKEDSQKKKSGSSERTSKRQSVF